MNRDRTYALFIAVNKDLDICAGRLGNINFKKGSYLYFGSAKKGLNSRIKRHLTKNKKKFWHIDYLVCSNESEISEIWTSAETEECQITQNFYRKGYSFINRFGSSDCQCKSHLFFVEKDIREVKNLLEREGFKNADKDYF